MPHRLEEPICQGDIVVPQSVREGLGRVIRDRLSAAKFYRRIQCADKAHDDRVLVLYDMRDKLEQHARDISKQLTRKKLQEDDLVNGRITVQGGGRVVSTLSNSRSQTAKADVSPVEYTQSSTEIAVANFMLDLLSIRDWIKAQWTRAARGTEDFATIAHCSYAARELARRVLLSVDLEIGWQDPTFLDYAKKAGLLFNENEYVSVGAHSTFIVFLRNKTKIRWHVYSSVKGYMHAPNFEEAFNSDLLAQLERWLLCAAISGWDADQDLTTVQDRCLIAALTTQIHTVLHYWKSKAAPDSPQTKTRGKLTPSPLDDAIKDLKSFSERLPSLKFSPDPWTLSHIIAQTTSLIRYQEMALSLDCLCAAVYSEKYRMIAKISSAATLQKDFGFMLPSGSLNTVTELDRAWKMLQKKPSRIHDKFSMQWTWKVFQAEHIPIMFSDFLESSSNYVSMLDKIRSRVGEINGRRLNISALPALSKNLESLVLSDLAKVQVISPLYVSGRTIRILAGNDSDERPETGGLLTLAADTKPSSRVLSIYIGNAPLAILNPTQDLMCSHGIGKMITDPAEQPPLLEESDYSLRDAEGRISTTVKADADLARFANHIRGWVQGLPPKFISKVFEVSHRT
ncbi:hypothetical protein V491_02128 [Pseudogymnoascus sp. VKM F-3775]|nr:hypothetical protein V491_02128 [Pseudogymnoascus sp. VKM F-3775]